LLHCNGFIVGYRTATANRFLAIDTILTIARNVFVK
jgi:hypothetical protein